MLNRSHTQKSEDHALLRRNGALLEAADTRRKTPLVLGPYYTKGIRFHQLATAIEAEHLASLLCIGCGNGYLETLLSPSIKIESIDLDEKTIAEARALNVGIPNRNFQKLDLFDGPKWLPDTSLCAVRPPFSQPVGIA